MLTYHHGLTCLPTLPLTQVPIPFLIHASGALDTVMLLSKHLPSAQDLCNWESGLLYLPPNLKPNANKWQYARSFMKLGVLCHGNGPVLVSSYEYWLFQFIT
jgi:hypothetical protein